MRDVERVASTRARLERGLLVNGGLIVAARAVTAGLAIAIVPPLISRLGLAGYGVWEAMLALASLTAIVQSGISGAVMWRVSEAHARGDAAEIRRLIRLGAGTTWALLIVLLPIAWLAREPVVDLLNVPPEFRLLALNIFPVITALLLLGGLCDALEAVTSGVQRTGLVSLLGAGVQIVNYSVALGLIVSGVGFWGLVAGQAAAFTCRLAGAWAIARAVFGTVSLSPTIPRKDDLSSLRYSGLLSLSGAAGAMRDQMDKVILASLASPTWVGYYGIAARLSSLVTEILRPLYAPLITAAGALKAVGDWEGVKRIYGVSMAAVSTLSGLVLVAVAGLVDPLIALWIGHPIPEARLLVWLLIAGSAAAVVLTGPGTAICRGCGRAGIETTYLLFNLVLNVVVTIWLVMVMGPVGTAVATGATWAASSILFLILLHRRLDLPAGASRRAVATALLASAVAVVLYRIASFVGPLEDRTAALWWVIVLGFPGAIAYLGLGMMFRLVSLRQVYRGWVALTGRAA